MGLAEGIGWDCDGVPRVLAAVCLFFNWLVLADLSGLISFIISFIRKAISLFIAFCIPISCSCCNLFNNVCTPPFLVLHFLE